MRLQSFLTTSFACCCFFIIGYCTRWLEDSPNPPEIIPQAQKTDDICVHFSPNGGCTNEIMRNLGLAKKQVRVFAYSFTSEPIAQTLILLAMGGIDVQVIIDSGSAKRSEADNLASNGVKVYLDSKHAIMHSKVIIIDDDTVISGSFNFSKNAEERNHENLIIIKSPKLVKLYLNEWEKHKQHSQLKAAW
ncbi:phospholipase D family protein [Candidatus Parcubacteria bacterium]|nr:MAG: phospholipase D family protein [Candidatus Parcubacteria bacterium]